MMFNVYLTNLGKYNEGELIGEWMSLPISVEGFGRVLQRIGINKEYEEWFITDYDMNISGLSRYFGEYANLEEMSVPVHGAADVLLCGPCRGLRRFRRADRDCRKVRR